MLETAKKQNVSSTKIYDLLIGLGADKKKAEFAIGEFVKDIPKILASHTTEKNLDPTVPVSRGDIWRSCLLFYQRNLTKLYFLYW